MSAPILTDATADAALRGQGYVILDLLPPQAVSALLAVFAAHEALHRFDFIASVLLPDHGLRASVHDGVAPLLRRHVMPLLPGHRLVLGSFAAKRAAAPMGQMPLHQDCSFTEETRGTGITLWCPLVDVGPENGMLGVVPGSHLLANAQRDAKPLLPLETHAEIEARYLRGLPMRAGQVLVMDNRLVHGSKPNLGNAARPVAAGVAVPADAPLLCCYADENSTPPVTEIYAVPDDFYLRHAMCTRPREGTHLATVPRMLEALTSPRMRALLGEITPA